MDIAVVGVGASGLDAQPRRRSSPAGLDWDAVAPTPLFASAASAALAGKPADEATFRAVGELARQAISPIDDMRGTGEFRRHLTGVLVERTLAAAVERARAGSS
ncbi:MAG: hypothetical protein U0992_09910 [Planctomycetaceae bacterium]